MPIYKTKGIILRSRDLGETDRIITILTQKKGKISAIAKGIRRPGAKFSGNLELFCYSDLVLAEGRDLDIVTSAESINCFKSFREDLKKTAIAFYVVELTDKLTGEKVQFTRILNLILETFNKLETKTDLDLLKTYFMLNLIEELGFKPELTNCLKCHLKPKKPCFSSKEGGLLCHNCVKIDPAAIPISITAIKVLRLFLERNLKVIDRLPKDINKKEIDKICQYGRAWISLVPIIHLEPFSTDCPANGRPKSTTFPHIKPANNIIP